MGKLQPPALFLTGHFCRSVTKSCPALCNPVNCTTPGFPVLHYLPRVCLNLCPLSQWHHPTISSSVALFSSCSQYFPASVFSNKFALHISSQSFGTSASVSVLPMNIQSFFLSGLTGLISLLSKELSSIFFSTTVWKHQFFSVQPSSWSSSHICIWLMEKP